MNRFVNKRLYNGRDSQMIESAATFHSLFNDNIADFTAFDSTLDAAFAADWLAKIDDARSVVLHSQIKDIQAQKTENVLALMEQCRIKYNEVKFFGKKVFRTKPSIQNELGLESYKHLRGNQDRMITFMDEMHKGCVTYAAQLMLGGMSQAAIDEIATLGNELANANTLQENYIKSVRTLTQQRIEILNICFEKTRIVIEAAVVVYYNDYARRTMFIYNPHTGGGTGDGADSEIIDIIIPNTDNPVQVFDIPFEPTRQIMLTNNGPAEVEFYIADDINGMGTPILLIAGMSETLTSDMLGFFGNLLIARTMPGTGAQAAIHVEISLEV